jgi:hypothetical protein
MKHEQLIADAKEVGAEIGTWDKSGNGQKLIAFTHKELSAFASIRDARKDVEIARLREALKLECGGRCNAEYNPCNARQALAQGEQNE